MSVDVTSTIGKTALYDTVTGLAFGPTFDSEWQASDFLCHLEDIGERDPRVIPAAELSELAREFVEEWEA